MTGKIAKSKLKEKRLSAGYSQEGLARKVDVSKGTIINWENSQNDIPGIKLVRLSQVFNCNPIELYEFSDEVESSWWSGTDA